MLDLFDTHVHLDAKEYDCDRAAVLQRAHDSGVTRFITIGAGDALLSATRAIDLAESHSNIWASAGVHPHDAKIPLERAALQRLASHPRVVAIGETGLDFHYNFASREEQRLWFVEQIEVAKQVHKPLIIHCREAAEECLEILSKHDARQVGGVFHCYSENAAFAKRLREINFMISMPGMVTFKNAEGVREAIREIPLEQLMLETDGPFLAPVPHRGKRCESSFMVETARTIATLKKITIEELGKATTANALRFFNIEG